MEVHHHAHTSKKKWTHYLWEFIMLFLAVFCGFLAENQREHMVEHIREKQYMQSMVEDLTLDSAVFSRTIAFIDTSLIPIMDSSLEILYHKDISLASVKREMYQFVPRCHQFLTVVIADKTSSQLKSSGNLRLIRSKRVTDSLALYWRSLDFLNNATLPVYSAARLVVKDINMSVFNMKYYEEYNLFGNAIVEGPLELVSDDKKQIIKLANYISDLRDLARRTIRQDMAKGKRRATDLIKLIKDTYHFK